MAIDWKAFWANGGYSNENSDPQSYDDEDDYNDEYERYDDWLFTRNFYSQNFIGYVSNNLIEILPCCIKLL